MPFYDYKCSNCGAILEDVWEMPSDGGGKVCAQCGSKSLNRCIGSIAGINFKDLPKGHNLSATERRRLWNSDDPKDFKKIS